MRAGCYGAGSRRVRLGTVTVRAVQLRDIMTSAVVTAGLEDDILHVARLMRDLGVGSVVICDPRGDPVAMITDRDVAVRVMAESRPASEPVRAHATRPLITG